MHFLNIFSWVSHLQLGGKSIKLLDFQEAARQLEVESKPGGKFWYDNI